MSFACNILHFVVLPSSDRRRLAYITECVVLIRGVVDFQGEGASSLREKLTGKLGHYLHGIGPSRHWIAAGSWPFGAAP